MEGLFSPLIGGSDWSGSRVDFIVHDQEIIIPKHAAGASTWTVVGVRQIRVRIFVVVAVACNEKISSRAEDWAATRNTFLINIFERIRNKTI